MSDIKSLRGIDILREEIADLIDADAQSEFQAVVRRRYTAELLASCTRHIKGGWPIDECSLIYLHWLCRYPPERDYERHNGLPQADFGAVVKRVMHLSEGWADTHLAPSSPEERVRQVLPLPEELSEFSDCTLFADGVEYGRTKRGISGEAAAKFWYGVKTGGPAWRVVVHLSKIHPFNP
jgi:hypothetical protein